MTKSVDRVSTLQLNICSTCFEFCLGDEQILLFGEGAFFSALDLSNCQQHKIDQLYYLFLKTNSGRGGTGGRGSLPAVAANMKNLCVDLEYVDMYISFY